MELQSNDYERCLEIIPESVTQPEPKAVPSYQYSESEIQHLSVLDIEQWKHIGLFSIPPQPLVSSTQNINANIKGQSQKRPREEAIEYAAKALFELSSIHQLTRSAIKTEKQSIQPYFRPTNTLQTSVSIPYQQRINVMNDRLATSQSSLQKAIIRNEKVTKNRSNIINQMSILCRYWKLTSLSSDSNRQIPISALYRGDVTIDCSFVSYGDHLSTISEYLVPISAKVDILCVSDTDVNRHVSTIELQLHHKQVGLLASTTAWDITQHHIHASITDMDDNLSTIHQHCIKRRHDALCTRLFGRLRYHAKDLSSQWILKPHIDTNISSSSISNDDHNILNILCDCNLLSSSEIWSMERGMLRLGLSEHLSINISLIPISSSHNHHYPIESSSSSFMISSLLIPCLSNAFLVSQILLIDHFSSSLKETTLRESSTDTLTSSSSSSSSISPSISSLSSNNTSLSNNNTSLSSDNIGFAKKIEVKALDREKYKLLRIDQLKKLQNQKNQPLNSQVSILNIFVNVVKVKLWKLMLEDGLNYHNIIWKLDKSASSDVIYAALTHLHHTSSQHSYLYDTYTYSIQLQHLFQKSNVSICISSTNVSLEIISLSSNSITSNMIVRDFTSIRDLLDYVSSMK